MGLVSFLSSANDIILLQMSYVFTSIIMNANYPLFHQQTDHTSYDLIFTSIDVCLFIYLLAIDYR